MRSASRPVRLSVLMEAVREKIQTATGIPAEFIPRRTLTRVLKTSYPEVQLLRTRTDFALCTWEGAEGESGPKPETVIVNNTPRWILRGEAHRPTCVIAEGVATGGRTCTCAEQRERYLTRERGRG